MKRHNHSTSAHAAPKSVRSAAGAFTLVELLVVITIIGILAGLITAAAYVARITTINFTITTEVKTGLEGALVNYKEMHGELPPDFAGINSPVSAYELAAKNAVIRHFAKAYPKFQISGANVSEKWDNLQTIVLNNWGVNINGLSPATALVFWLGGKPNWKLDASNNPILPSNAVYDPLLPVQSFLGFSADQTNPFNNNPSRIKSSLEINPVLLNDRDLNGCFGYWPSKAFGTKNTGAFVYFRAENGNYTMDGLAALSNFNNIKRFPYPGAVGIWPAYDTRLSNPATPNYVWMNKELCQIFSAGMDLNYGPVVGPLAYPSGDNYQEQTFDDITNFSGGKLENDIP